MEGDDRPPRGAIQPAKRVDVPSVGRRRPGYSASIWLTDETALGFHVSALGPYYGIHRPGAPEEEPAASEIAREIEATYPGHQPVPPELGDEVVPDVDLDGAPLGQATIYVCLFSIVWINDPASISE